MIERVVSFALNKPLFIVLGLILFVAGGFAAFKSLPIEAFPDVTDTQVNVITLYPGRAAEEVEKQVTVPLEVVCARWTCPTERSRRWRPCRRRSAKFTAIASSPTL